MAEKIFHFCKESTNFEVLDVLSNLLDRSMKCKSLLRCLMQLIQRFHSKKIKGTSAYFSICEVRRVIGLIQVLQTQQRLYAYDGRTNQIYAFSNDFCEEAQNKKKMQTYLKMSKNVSEIKEIQWRLQGYQYLDALQGAIPKLILQLTCRCNLDCDYCVYSGNYDYMEPHRDFDMSEKTMYRALDFFATHNKERNEAIVEFYGGEAFLRFDLIKNGVEYARKILNGKRIYFGITTNGLLLNDDVLRWIAKTPELMVSVTVNGPLHDAHRKKRSGQGSLDEIMRNIERIRKGYPKVWEQQIRFFANVCHQSDIPALVQFYKDKIGRPPVSITYIRKQNGNEKIIRMTEKKDLKSSKQLCAYYRNKEDPYYRPIFAPTLEAIQMRPVVENGGNGIIGSCLPGLGRLFVHADGCIGICESVCDKLIIGNLKEGFNKEKLQEIYQTCQKLYNQQCKSCWAQRLCTVCFKDIVNPDGTIMEQIPQDCCEESKEHISRMLKLYCEIADNDPQRLSTYEYQK